MDDIPYIISTIKSDDFGSIADWMMRSSLWIRYGLTEEKIIRGFEGAVEQGEFVSVIRKRDNGFPCGFTRVLRAGAFGQKPYLKQIGVDPNHSGNGLGARLIAHVEHECSTFSDQMFLLVSDFNRDAQRFYERHGYQQIGKIPAYILPDVAELIYHKHLQQ